MPADEREQIVAWLRNEADMARSAQNAAAYYSEETYHMGGKDALLLAAMAIERGEYIAAPSSARRAQEPPNAS